MNIAVDLRKEKFSPIGNWREFMSKWQPGISFQEAKGLLRAMPEVLVRGDALPLEVIQGVRLFLAVAGFSDFFTAGQIRDEKFFSPRLELARIGLNVLFGHKMQDYFQEQVFPLSFEEKEWRKKAEEVFLEILSFLGSESIPEGRDALLYRYPRQPLSRQLEYFLWEVLDSRPGSRRVNAPFRAVSGLIGKNKQTIARVLVRAGCSIPDEILDEAITALQNMIVDSVSIEELNTIRHFLQAYSDFRLRLWLK